LKYKIDNTYLKTKDPYLVLPQFPQQYQEWLPPTWKTCFKYKTRLTRIRKNIVSCISLPVHIIKEKKGNRETTNIFHNQVPAIDGPINLLRKYHLPSDIKLEKKGEGRLAKKY